MCNSKIIFLGGCFISDISYNGFNLGSKIQQIKTAEDCQKKCQEADGCTHFTWNSKTTTHNKRNPSINLQQKCDFNCWILKISTSIPRNLLYSKSTSHGYKNIQVYKS